VVIAWLVSACSTSPPRTASTSRSTAASSPTLAAADGISGQWDASPCTPDGDVTTIIGKLVIAPFGKGTDGARLVPDDGAPWVLTYRATPAMRELDGKRVSARGRPCSKQGQAIIGRHFDADTLSEP
ncbi:MAG TPA: hypothetical protein VF403_01420, partial [Kofleriaceae bacterium]